MSQEVKMAENDIYNNLARYERFKTDLNSFTKKRDGYYCKSPKNIKYFKELFKHFEAKDLSYIRRMRLLQSFKLISYAMPKDLKECDRKGINQIVTFMHTRYKSPKSKGDFIKDIKYFWRILFPELDERGRIDETLTPYSVRHLSAKMDKSKEKLRGDKLTVAEFEKLVEYFNKDTRMQAYLTLAVESLGRPQEILYTKIKDLEFYDNYAKIWISEHGKEGTGFLQCIDSFPYLIKWLKKHPDSKNQDAFVFINTGRKQQGKQWTPFAVNKMLRNACKKLSITKPITCYSLKRNGVTFRRLRGDSDTQIQHAARWTSTKQLKNYDMSDQEDALRIELVKRGKLKADDPKHKKYQPSVKTCICGKENGFSEEFCSVCSRPLDREKIIQLEKQKELDALNKFMDIPEIQDLFQKVHVLQERMKL